MYTTFSLGDLTARAAGPTQTSRRRACDLCRRLKIRCRNTARLSDCKGSNLERCEECRSTKSRCTYTDRSKKRREEYQSRHPNKPPIWKQDDLISVESTDVVPRLIPPHQSEHHNNTPELTNNVDDSLREDVRTAQWTPMTATSANFDGTSGSQVVENFGPAGEICQAFPMDDGIFFNECSETLHFRQDIAAINDPYSECSLTSDMALYAFDLPQDDDVWHSVHQFFDKCWFVFPLLSYDSLHSRLSMQAEWSAADPSLRTLLLAIRMANATCDYRMTSKSGTALLELIRNVEKCRLDYDFAESPTLDEVVVSTFLFVACNVLEKHNRAYLYLDEAFSLLGNVETPREYEFQRKQLIYQVLYNTEAASTAIYPNQSHIRRGRRPAKLLDKLPTTSTGNKVVKEQDRMALCLLNKLSEIHSAENAVELSARSIDLNDLRTLCGSSLQDHQFFRIQAADVAITCQWQLSEKLVTRSATDSPAYSAAKGQLDALGVTTMAWVCPLREGELRIVGLGKVLGLIRSIHAMARGIHFGYILAGLVSAMMREDHDKHFASELASILTPMHRLDDPPLQRPNIDENMDNYVGRDGQTGFSVGITPGRPTENSPDAVPTTTHPHPLPFTRTGEAEAECSISESGDWFVDLD